MIGEWFHTSVGVRQGYLLSTTLFKIFLERIMTDSQHWRADNQQSEVYRWHRRLGRKRRGTGQPSETTGRSILAIWHRNQCLANHHQDNCQRKRTGGSKHFKYLGTVISEEGSKSWQERLKQQQQW